MENYMLSKDTILQYISQEEIYLKFLGLNEFPKRNISSPFTADKNPSFSLYKEGLETKYKCHSSGFSGDVWQFVADLFQLNSKTQFIEVLETVVKENNLPLQNQNKKTDINSKTTQNLINTSNTVAKNRESSKISVHTRDFTELDLQWWKNIGVEKTILQKYNVHSILNYTWSERSPIYTKKESVAFAFELENNFKLYIPNQAEIGISKNILPPFKTGIFGFEQLGTAKKENIIICEGEKDVIVANSRGFNAVTFGSGSTTIKKESIKLLQFLCKSLFVCFDADDTGIIGIQKLTQSNSNIIPLYLPRNENIKGYDLTDYFQEHTIQDFQKIIDLAVINNSIDDITKIENPTIFHIVEDYLSKKYDLRYNTIALEIETTIKSSNNWDICNENSLWIELQKKNIKIGFNALIAILKSDFVPKYNPIVAYYENLTEWNKQTDYITQYSQYIILSPTEDKEQFEYHFKKWCVRAVKCAMIDDYFNKQAFILSDDGKSQNAGKTSWINFLCPNALQNFIKMDLPKDDKDAKISLGKNIFINLDELANLSKQDVNGLKSLFSTPKIKVRLPYDKKDSVIQRICSFIGSTNNSTFLSDETGSVRWLCFVLERINWNYRKEFNIDNLWAQAYYLANDKTFDETFTKEDIFINEKRNEKFQILTPEKEMIIKYFEKPSDENIAKKMTTTDILNYINGLTTIRLNVVSVGRALTALKYEKSRIKDSYCYIIAKKQNIEY